MNRTTNFRPHAVTRQDRSDGTILLTSDYPLGPVADRTGDWLHRWAAEALNRVFLAERSGPGWREVTYAEALQQVRAVAASLLGRGMGPETPIMVLSGNGVDHGLLALAAQYIGAPIVPVAEQYSLIPEAHGRLAEVATLIRPAMAYTVDADAYAGALAIDALQGVEIVATKPGEQSVTPFAGLLKGDGADADAAFATVTPDSVVKILMTSGSTSSPKGVLTTHRMMCVNQAMIAGGLPFLTHRPHRIVDWLPWNHVFGGSHNFNMMLANGGSLYVDDGKPVTGPFERTVEALRLTCGTLVFNVPVGFSLLLDVLRGDSGLRQSFFEDLDMIFYAGASLPQDIWEGFEEMAMEVKGEVPLMTSSWGLTETAPAVLLQQEPTDRSGVVGVPLPGATVKLIPTDDGRAEVRVAGPNVMPGYFQDAERSAAAFDDEGYFITGDAMKFVDPADASRGLRFDGRISEDFKLQTGTWVRAAALRADALAALAPLAADLVVTGEGRTEIGLLIVPNHAALATAGHSDVSADGALIDPGLLDAITRLLIARAHAHEGSSTHIARVLVMAEPPSLAAGEITAKGNLNYRRLLSCRADLLDKLYSDDPAVVCI